MLALPARLRFGFLLLAVGQMFGAIAAETPANAPAGYSRIVAFGDSLSSSGRGKSGPSTGPEPTVENGNYPRLTWVQQLSELAALGPLVKWENGGSDYAIGGSTTTDLAAQVSRYLDARNGQANPTALHIVWSGGNDLTHVLRDRFKQHRFTALFGLQGALASTSEAAATRLAAQIDRLARAGAVHVLWVNLPDLSRTPSLAAHTPSFPGASGLAKRAFLRASDAFNRRMEAAVAELRRTHPGLDLVTLDAHAVFDRLMSHPCDYGFTDVKLPSRTSNRHLFFDNAHPTAHGHYEFARIARDQLVALGHISAAASKDSFEARLTPILGPDSASKTTAGPPSVTPTAPAREIP